MAKAQGPPLVAGVDEAGRGCLAGPVVAAAVVFEVLPEDLELKDSKSLSPKRREVLFEEIYRRALTIGLGIVSSEDVDRLNILKASLRAMEEAVRSLSPSPDLVLVDGSHPLQISIPQRLVVHGDRECPSIAAASIIAKVTRDRIMEAYKRHFPFHGFERHKGYGTREHLEALSRYGPTPIHRRSFRGVKGYLG